jgi:hypothetical protein
MGELNAYQVADLIFKTLGLLAIVGGLMTLLETRRRRMVDMYWKIYDQYLSAPSQLSREAMSEVEARLDLTAERDETSARYRSQLHDSKDPADTELVKRVQWRLRFLSQVGYLLDKRLLDPDLTYSLLGAGVDVDRAVIGVALTAHRNAHSDQRMYDGIERFVAGYTRWKASPALG